MSESVRKVEFDSLVNLSQRELLVRIGMGSLQTDALHGTSPDMKSILREAKLWFKKNIVVLRLAICGNPHFDTVRKLAKSEKATAAATLYDLIATFQQGYSIAIASMYLINYGVDKFCQDNDTSFIESIDR